MVNCVNGCGSLEASIYEGVTIDSCNSCMGVWLDYSELTHIVKIKEESWSNEYIDSITKEIGSHGIPSSENDRKLSCPKCDTQMPPVNYQYSSGIIVNICPSSHGVWLDSGELDKIQIYMEKWRKTALRDRNKYDAAISEVKAQHEERFTINQTKGPSRFEFVNAILLGILKL